MPVSVINNGALSGVDSSQILSDLLSVDLWSDMKDSLTSCFFDSNDFQAQSIITQCQFIIQQFFVYY